LNYLAARIFNRSIGQSANWSIKLLCNSHLVKNLLSQKAGLLTTNAELKGGHSSFIFPQLMHG